MNADMLKKLKHGFFTASAVGVLMAAQGAVAGDEYKDQAKAGQTHGSEQHTQTQGAQTQSTQAQNTQAQGSQQSQSQGPQFSQVDSDNDGEAKWNDIEPEFQEQLSKANWNEQNVLDQFDSDNDQSLNADEYENFKSVLMAHVGTQGGQQQAQMEQGQQEGQQQAQMEQGQQQDQQEQQYEQQAELEQGQQEQQQAPQEQQEFEEQAQLESDQTQEQQGGIDQAQQDQAQQDQAQQDQAQQDQAQQDQEYTEQAELEQQEEQQLDTEQQRDQDIQTEQDQQFDSGQQQDQQFDQESQQAQQLETEQQAAQQQGSPAQAQQADSALMSMPVDQVAQAEVVNSRGEEIGQVSRVVRNTTTGEVGLVVRSGGILGLGGSSVLVSLGEVSQMDEGRLLWDTMLSQDEIAEMPEFDETDYSEISGTEYATLEEAQERG